MIETPTHDGRIYPWGNEWGDRLANYCDRNCKDDPRYAAFDDGYAELAPVSTFPAGASPYGAWDLVGNVWEWTAERLLRGGALYNDPYYVRTALRETDAPPDEVGFRLVRDVVP